MSCEWNATVAVQNTVFESELARYPLADLLFSFFFRTMCGFCSGRKMSKLIVFFEYPFFPPPYSSDRIQSQ